MILQIAKPYENYYLDTANGDVYSIAHPAHKGKLYKLKPNKNGKIALYMYGSKVRSLFTSAMLMKRLTTNTFGQSSIKDDNITDILNITPIPGRFKRLPESYASFVYDTIDKNLYSIKTGNMRLLKPALHRKEEGWQIALSSSYMSYEFLSIVKVIELASRGNAYTIQSSSTFLLTKNRKPIRTALTEYDLQDYARSEIKIFPGEYEIWERKGSMQLIPESIQYVTD